MTSSFFDNHCDLYSLSKLLNPILAIPHLVAVANKELKDKDMMKIAEAQDKATLKKFRPYIENAKVIFFPKLDSILALPLPYFSS